MMFEKDSCLLTAEKAVWQRAEQSPRTRSSRDVIVSYMSDCFHVD